MSNSSQTSWIAAGLLALVGILLTGAGFRFMNGVKDEERDAFGTPLSERFGMLTLNGVAILLAAFAWAAYLYMNG